MPIVEDSFFFFSFFLTDVPIVEDSSRAPQESDEGTDERGSAAAAYHARHWKESSSTNPGPEVYKGIPVMEGDSVCVCVCVCVCACVCKGIHVMDGDGVYVCVCVCVCVCVYSAVYWSHRTYNLQPKPLPDVYHAALVVDGVGSNLWSFQPSQITTGVPRLCRVYTLKFF